MDAFSRVKEKSIYWWFDKFAISKCKAKGEKVWREIIISFLIDSNKRIGDRKKGRKNIKKRKIKHRERKSFKGKRANYLRKRILIKSKRARA